MALRVLRKGYFPLLTAVETSFYGRASESWNNPTRSLNFAGLLYFLATEGLLDW